MLPTNLRNSLVVVSVVLVLTLAASAKCSNANVTGKYGFLSTGFDQDGNPIAVLGYINANGKGTFTGTEIESDNGSVESAAAKGTYSINADCTGSGTITPKGGKASHFALVVVSGGTTLQSLTTDAGAVQSGTTQAEGKATCTVAGVKGTYGIQAEGVFLGVGAVALDGLLTFDGKGNVSGTESGSIAGQIFTAASVSGSYTIKPNCTGTAAFSISGEPTLHSSLVMTNGAKNMLVLETDSSTVVAGSGQQ